MKIKSLISIILFFLVASAACGKGKPPVARPTPPAPPPSASTNRPDDPPAPMREPVPPEPLPSDSVAGKSLDDLNRDSPLRPIFLYDSSDVDDAGREPQRRRCVKSSDVGHHDRRTCDERGTAIQSVPEREPCPRTY